MLLYKLAAFLLFAAAACTIQVVMYARHANTIIEDSQPPQHQQHGIQDSSTRAAGVHSCQQLHLGFDYPELRPLKQHLESLMCQPPPAADVQAAYASILGLYTPCPAPTRLSPTGHLAGFLAAAQQLLAPHGLRHCGLDPSLLASFHLDQCQQAPGPPANPPATTAAARQQPHSSSPSAGSKHINSTSQAPGQMLLAANLHNSGHMIPNLVVQTLQLALLLPPGTLGVSLYESGSSDLTRYWMTLLHLLLLPLGTPHQFVTGGALRPTQGLPRIQLMAALRSAALEPVMHSPLPTPTNSSSRSRRSSSRRAGRLPGVHQQGRQQRVSGSSRPRQAGSAAQHVLSHSMAGFSPDYIAFTNDVFLCAGDVLRLAAHQADLSCGLDFYVGPWETGPSLHWASDRLLDTAQQEQRPHPGDPAAQQLRFYDKWVARDIRGGLMSNSPPYLRHPTTQQQLSQGLPVPMYCCWNGLVVLKAAPLVTREVAFRSHSPGECRASECSLLCDDLHAAGHHHVVMDPGVQLAYDADQLGLLGQGMQQQHWQRRQRQVQHLRRRHLLQTKGDGTNGLVTVDLHSPAADVQQPHSKSWKGNTPAGRQQRLPQLPWSQVAAAASAVRVACRAAAKAALAVVRQQESPAAGLESDGWRRVECCNLQPGHNYVNFTADCHPVDVTARWGVTSAAGH